MLLAEGISAPETKNEANWLPELETLLDIYEEIRQKRREKSTGSGHKRGNNNSPIKI